MLQEGSLGENQILHKVGIGKVHLLSLILNRTIGLSHSFYFSKDKYFILFLFLENGIHVSETRF